MISSPLEVCDDWITFQLFGRRRSSCHQACIPTSADEMASHQEGGRLARGLVVTCKLQTAPEPCSFVDNNIARSNNLWQQRSSKQSGFSGLKISSEIRLHFLTKWDFLLGVGLL